MRIFARHRRIERRMGAEASVGDVWPADQIALEGTRTIGGWLTRLVAVVVLVAGALKVGDVTDGVPSGLLYAPAVLAVLGATEILLGAWALWRPGRRLPAFLLAGFVLAVTVYLLTVPPGELERYGCQCFGTRLRFQDVRDHLRFNGVLIVLAVVGAWLARNTSAPSSSARAG